MERKAKRSLIFTKIIKPILSFNAIEKEIMSKKFRTKYHKFQTNITFFRYFTSKFVKKKKCHITSVFNDYLLFINNKENLKQIIKKRESYIFLKRYSVIYKEYVEFYCFPMITEFTINNILVNCIESKVELFYGIKFKEVIKKSGESKNEGIIISSKKKSINDNESKNEINKSFFDETIRNQIDMISNDKISGIKNGESKHFMSSSNDALLSKLTNELSNKDKKENIKINIEKQNNIINSKKNLTITKMTSNIDTKEIYKLNQIYKNYKDNKNISNKNKKNNKNIFAYKGKTFFIKNALLRIKNKSLNNNNFVKSNNNKDSFHFGNDKTKININSKTLHKSLSRNKTTFNSFNIMSKREKQNKNRKILSVKNQFNDNLKNKETNKKNHFTSLDINLNKIIKISNNIINIKIIKNKQEKEKISSINSKRIYNLKVANKKELKKNSNNNLNIINKIIGQNSKIYSRNQHKSKSTIFISSRNINFNNINVKENSENSLSQRNRNIYNKISNNSLFRKMILKPEKSLFEKSNFKSKHRINNESFIKGLNLSSIRSLKMKRNDSKRIYNLKRKIN